jgi:hypothetical protein
LLKFWGSVSGKAHRITPRQGGIAMLAKWELWWRLSPQEDGSALRKTSQISGDRFLNMMQFNGQITLMVWPHLPVAKFHHPL